MNERISKLRKLKKKNQDEFAESLGLTKNYISLVETGKREPSDRTIKDICRIYNVNETWLRTGEGEIFLPIDREKDLAELSVKFLTDVPDSFRRKLVSYLAKMTDEQWQMVEDMVNELATKKESKD